MNQPSSIEESWKQAGDRFLEKTGKKLTTAPTGLKGIHEILSREEKSDSSRKRRQMVLNTCSCIKQLAGFTAKITEWSDDLDELISTLESFLSKFKNYESIGKIAPLDQSLVTAIHNVLIKFVDVCAFSINFMIKINSKSSKLWGTIKKTLFEDDSGVKAELDTFKHRVTELAGVLAMNTLGEVMKLRYSFENSELMGILDRASSSNASKHYQEAYRHHEKAERIGSWFLESPEFQQWVAGDIKCLLLHGVGGSGKTVLTSTAIRHIVDKLKKDPNQALSYFFFKTQYRTTVIDLLAWVIRSKCIPEDGELRAQRQKAFLEAFRKNYCILSEDSLWEGFESILATSSTSYIIIDALDECSTIRDEPRIVEAEESIMEMLNRFWKIKNLRVLITCRNGSLLEQIEKTIGNLQRKTVREFSNVAMTKDLVDSDIDIFIGNCLEKNNFAAAFERYPDWREKIRLRLKRNGTFLLVATQLERLEQRIHRAEGGDLAKILNELPEDLNGFYRSELDEIPVDLKEISRTILKCLLTAERPLYIEELEALIKSIYNEPFNVLKIFSSLLTLSGEDKDNDRQVLWTNDTTIREYLTGKDSGYFHVNLTDAHRIFARICINYLKLTEPTNRHAKDDKSCIICPRRSHFLEYAVNNWYKHALIAPKKAADVIIDKRLSDTENESHSLIGWCQVSIDLVDGTIASPASFRQNIRTAAIDGYKEVTKLLLSHGSPVESPLQDYDALMAATIESYPSMLAILLEKKQVTPLKSAWWTEDQQSKNDNPRNEYLVSAICQLLLESGANPNNDKYKFARTALHLASGRNSSKVLEGLISKIVPSDVDKKDSRGSAALHFAAASGSLECVRVLLSSDADVNIRSNPESVDVERSIEENFKATDYELLEAASNRNWERCIELVKGGANVRVANRDGTTPLHEAFRYGASDFSRLLIEKGANPNAKTIPEDHPRTALTQAVRNGEASLEMVQSLLEAGADPNIGDGHLCHNETPLHIAAKKGREDFANILLAYNADPNARDDRNKTPGDLARRKKFLDLAAKLDDANSGVVDRGGKGETPLHMACANNHYEVVQELLNKGADIQARANDGWTALHAAAMGGSKLSTTKQTVLDQAPKSGNLPIIRFLLAQPHVDQEAEDVKGDTALMTAVRASMKEAVQAFLEVGSMSASKKDWRGYTPLHQASEHGNPGIVNLLLERSDVDVEVQETNSGATPLLLAAQHGRTKVVRKLLKAGAKVDVVDRNGNTPLSVAKSGKHGEIVDMLVKYGGSSSRSRRVR